MAQLLVRLTGAIRMLGRTGARGETLCTHCLAGLTAPDRLGGVCGIGLNNYYADQQEAD